MDLFITCCVLIIVFFSTCAAITCLTDSDILTFLYSYIGKDPREELRGKVVWVTGASSGIGEGLAVELAKCGAKLTLSARREQELNRVKEDCLRVNGNLKSDDVLVLPFDMTDYSKHEESFEKILKHFGTLDILVSNAGRSQRAAWHEIDPEVHKSLFELNVFSLVNLNTIVVKYFYKENKGQLVVTSSGGGKVGIPFSGSYTASKFALHGYFESLRNESRGTNISITMLCPGPVFSGILREAFTSKQGDKFGMDVAASDRRMTAERCAYLSLVAIANKLEESWMALFPIIPFMYFVLYCPVIASGTISFLSRWNFMHRLRDSKDTMQAKKVN